MEITQCERDEAQRALKAAFNNMSRAIEYIFNGIPEGAQVRLGLWVPPNFECECFTHTWSQGVKYLGLPPPPLHAVL